MNPGKTLKRVSLTLFLSFVCLVAFAQNRTVTGVVKDITGESMIGVNVIVKGSTQGTITDYDGKYVVSDVPSNSTLQFTYVGYKSKDVAVGNQNVINVVLDSDTEDLDEVVVIGYGVVKKRDLTGSVASIKAEEIAKVSSSNAMQAMQAKVPGLDITQSSGESGAGLSMNLRGNRSISASNQPLILVDGVEYGSTIDVNPSDIESMEILKDASSTAIYGTRGANGVIIITTKRGKAGKTRVELSAYLSSNQPTNVPKVMYGRKEVQRLIDKANYQADAKSGNWGESKISLKDVLTEALADGTTEMDIYNDGSYTDWADMILQNGMTQNYEVSVSGGNENTNFNLSVGAMYEEGLLKRDNLDRYNLKANIDHKINKYFKTGTSILFTYKDHDKRNGSVFNQSLKMTTITHPYLSDGTLNVTPNPRYAAHCNPLLDEEEGVFQNNIESTRFFGNGYLEITPLKNVFFKSMFALDRSDSHNGLYQDYQSVNRYQSPGTGYISSSNSRTTNITWENTLNYITDFGTKEHELSALIGQSIRQSVYEYASTFGDCGKEHYYESAYRDLSKIGDATTDNSYVKSAMLSYFARLNFKLYQRFMLTASVRADGSSTLADGNQWGYFPSVAAAWRINDESFMETTSDWLSNLKLRASWGISGNAAVDAYSTWTTLSDQTIYYYLGAKSIAGKVPNSLGNPDLTWETTESYNLGLDFGILNNRISGSIDYYISNTNDLLYYKSTPPSSVYPTVLANVGETKGHGIEVSLNTSVFNKRNFNWDINWSYSRAFDEVVALSDGLEKNINGVSGYIVGQPVSIFYDYETDGCWGVGEFDKYKSEWEQRHPGEKMSYISGYGTPGTVKLNDMDDNGTIDEDDKRVYNRSPKHIFGMNNSFRYKNFDLSVLVFARVGGYISYGMNEQLNFESANWGDLDYWTPENTGAKFPNPGTSSSLYTPYKTSLMYEKADFIKIKDITLGYNLPKPMLAKAGIEGVRVYGSMKNFFTFSNIDNYDPERGGSIGFPLAKQVVVGVNVKF